MPREIRSDEPAGRLREGKPVVLDRRGFLLASASLAGGCAAVPRAGARAPVIDVHCHAGSGMNLGKPDAAPWTTWNDPEGTIRKMDEVGIDRTVIFPISNTSYEKANEEIAGFVRRRPDRFIGFAKHDQKSEAGRIRKLLLREVKELGLRGLKLHGAPTEEMLDAAGELEIPILCHPARVADLVPAVESRPRIDFILAHLGNFASRDWKEHLAAIEAVKGHPNLYLETSSVVFFDYLEMAARELPADKLLFGSDGPLLDQRVELYKVRLLKLPPEKEERVLGGNARRLLKV